MGPLRAGASRTWPWLALASAALATAVHLAPGWAEVLEYDRGRIAGGELWRLLTGHWAHWSLDHLLWNLAVCLLVGALWELRGERRALLAGLLGAPLAISLAAWLLLPEMERYRGLSGLACTLVVGLAVSHLGEALARGRRGEALAFAGLLAAACLKVAYELATGEAIFVDTGTGTGTGTVAFAAVPLAHAVGGLWGLIAAGWPLALGAAEPIRVSARS